MSEFALHWTVKGLSDQKRTSRNSRHRSNSVFHTFETLSIIFRERNIVAIVCFTVFRF